MSYVVAMIACKRACMTTDQAVDALRVGGFDEPVHVFAEPDVDDLTGRDGVIIHRNARQLGGPLNWLYALQTLRAYTSQANVLVVEDDVRYCVGARDALDEITRQRYGYASLHTPAREAAAVGDRRGWLKLKLGRIWGTQAICFSRWTLEHFAIYPPLEVGYAEYDYVLQNFYADRNWPAYYHAPSLADHVGWNETHLGRPSNMTEQRRGLGFNPAWRPVDQPSRR